MSRPKKSVADLQRECTRFNERCPIGTEVTVRLDSGAGVHTTTKTYAQVLGDHSVVVWVEGGRGCYPVERVTPKAVRA